MYYIFVYGTLMSRRRNNRLLVRERYIGPGTLENYAMYNVNPSYPGIVSEAGGKIEGEVYCISKQMLNILDNFEAEGNLYIRKAEDINVGSKSVGAFVYVWNKSVDNCDKVNEMPWKEMI